MKTGNQVEFRIRGSHAEAGAPDGTRHHYVGLHGYARATASVQATATTNIPSPTGTYKPSEFATTWLVRLRDLRNGREKPPGCAQALLTGLQAKFGSGDRAAAARALGVEKNLLNEVGKLAARKHPVVGRTTKRDAQPMTDADLNSMPRSLA